MQTAMVVPSQPPAADQQADRAAAKQALRRVIRAERKAHVTALAPERREAMEQRLVDHLWPFAMAAEVIAIYAPTGFEIDPTPLQVRASGTAKTFCYPAFADTTSPMIFRSGQCAEDCPVGGVQPPHQAKEVEPDLILVPLLGVDRVGHRLGQGGGHYDRALPALRAKGARIIGVGWAMQLLDLALPAEPWDVRLDAFVSPDGIVEFA